MMVGGGNSGQTDSCDHDSAGWRTPTSSSLAWGVSEGITYYYLEVIVHRQKENKHFFGCCPLGLNGKPLMGVNGTSVITVSSDAFYPL